MSIEVKVNEINDIAVVKLIGNLDTNSAADAETEINSWLEKGTKKMVINLEETKYVTSAGLRVFLATTKRMTAAGGAVKFCSPNEVVKEIIDISGFGIIIDIRATEQEAIEDL